ncbi:MAG: PAS domain S-box protein [Deltaproteobacteria bacterium]|nr:PAS domain S-box protein [Deltaproteobacteria bacterium]
MAKNKDPQAQKLRRQAEAIVKSCALPEESLPPEEAARLIHELRVHQIELEMQNDELRQAQTRLEESRLKYSDLYDFAPMGYLTLDRQGQILEANLTAAKLFGMDRSRFLGLHFALLLVDRDRRAFRRHLAQVLQTRTRGQVEVRLLPHGFPIMLLESAYMDDAEGRVQCRTSLTDITQLKQTQEALKANQEHLEDLVAARTQELQDTNIRLLAEMEERQRVQEFVKRLNQQISGILESLSDGFFTLNNDMVVTYFNNAAEQLLGRKREEIIGRHLFDAFPEARGSIFEENYTRAVKDKQPQVFEIYFDQPPYVNWYEIRVYPHPEGISVFFQVTPMRKQAEQALRESREDLNRAQAVAHTGSWRMDVRRNQLTWSDENHRIFGIPPGTLLTYEAFLATVHPEDRDYVDRKWNAALRGEPYDIEHRIVVGDTVKWVRERAELEFDAQGQLLGGFGTTQDITARKQAEEALRLERNRLTTLLETMQDGVYIVNQNYDIEYANPALIQEFGPAAGRKCYEYFHNRTEPCPWCKNSEVFAGQTVRWEWYSPTNQKTYDLIDTPIKNADGSFSKLEIFRDITERKRAEEVLKKAHDELEGLVENRTAELQWTLRDLQQEMEDRLQAEEEVRRLNKELEQRVMERTAQLEAVNRELESFAYSISHDLRAPLRAIHGFAGILLQESLPQLDPESQKMMKVMQESALRMDELIDALLAFSRMGRTEMRILPLDMGRLADSVFHELQENLPARTVKFYVQTLAPVDGDPILVRQVWINLLSNALKFTQPREAAVIEVGSRRRGEEVVYYVQDNGVGFDMRYVDKLFGVFQRLHGFNEFPGSGVGLALVQRIISRHGGRVWAEGKIDQGATFYFSLPARKENPGESKN